MKQKSDIEIAFDMYENLYVEVKERKPITFPDGIEQPDISERDKELLALHRAKLEMLLANESNRIQQRALESNENLGRKVFWLNIAMIALTFVLAISALLELKQ
ncbi:hypothetical protein [Vibrio europaeus]|uniref:hypothetical protein n=1 Tax=Vibrio europaeus TaxID=300876 RepID=UPI00148DFF34|nr:hypothetical protein [Vibrio europaeus]NOH26253.1 hypothetical protein [Vibrio europaeus]